MSVKKELFEYFFKRLVRGYKSVTGKDPEGLDLIKIRQEARQKLIDQNKVIEFRQPRSFKEEIKLMYKDKIDPNSEIGKSVRMEADAKKKLKKLNISETEIDLRGNRPYDTDEQILQRLKKQNEDSINRLKNKKEPEDMADGGVAGLLGERKAFQGGGADMSTVADSKGNVGAKSVSVSPSGNVTTSKTKEPDGPDDKGTSDQNMVQMLVNQGYTAKDIQRTFNPNVLDKIKSNPYINNPYTRGIARTTAYLYNPVVAGVQLRQLMQGKDLYDRTKQVIINPDYDEEDLTLGADYKDFADGGPARPGYQNGNGVADGDAERAALGKRVRQLMDEEGYDFGEAVRKAMEEGYADGGPARQNFSMGKRAFLKLLAGTGAGIAGLKSGLLGLGKGATKKAVTETVKQTAGSGTPPPYFFKLVEKIKTLGDDVGATQDRQIAKSMKSKDGKSEYFLEEDVTTGDTIIKKISKEDDRLVSKVEIMQHNKGKADELTKGKKPKDTYEEVTEYNSRIYKDDYNPSSYEDGINQEGISEIVEEAGVGFVKKADGGRIGYNVGKRVGVGLMNLINKKFGKGTMTTADKIAQPEKTIQQRIMEFEARNKPDAITIKPRQILDVPPMPAGFKLSREKLKKNYPELDKDMIDQIMELDKDMQGTVLTMLKNRRKNPDAYDKLLETKGDTLEFQEAFDEVTRKSNNADGGRIGFSKGGGLLKLFKFLNPKPKKPETVKDFLEKRKFLKSMVGETEKNKKARELKMLKKAMKDAKGYQFPSGEELRTDIEKKIAPILLKDRKLNATGGLANMLGE